MCKNWETIILENKYIEIDSTWSESVAPDWNEYFPEPFGGQESCVKIGKPAPLTDQALK